MGRILSSIGMDRRGGSAAGYAVTCLAIVLSGLFASQVVGPFLNARMAHIGHMLLDFGQLAAVMPAEQGAGGCHENGGTCPVHAVTSPVGYPGLGKLNTGGGPAFLVAASPSGN